MPTTRSATSAIAAGMPKPTRSTVPSSPMRPSIKRSSSIASLPTPPRTLHKRRGRGRAHASIEQEQEQEDDELPTLDAPSTSKAKVVERPVVQARKRVRVAGAGSALPTLDEDNGGEELDDHAVVDEEHDEAAAEDAFWLGQPGPSVPTVANDDNDDEDEEEDGNSPPALLDRPNRIKVQAPFSPPPSKHKHSVKSSQVKIKAAATISLVAPVTPPPRLFRSSPRRVGPVRDSGNNPFLDEEHSLASQPTLSPPNPTTPTPYVEPPTVTYVFRGARALMANHLYKAETFQEERAKLPMEHPDYEPSELCPPKKLFVREIAHVRRLQPMRQAKMAPRTPSPTRPSRSPQRQVGGIASTPRRRHTPKSPGGGELSKAFGPTRGIQR